MTTMAYQAFLFLIFFTIFINHGKICSAGKIVGGQAVELGELPYMAIIGNMTLFCGGSIISRTHVLTSAQCIHTKIGKLNSDIRLHVGTAGTYGGDIHYVKRVSVHPKFLKNYPESILYDVGILTLCKAITFNEYKQPVKLPTREVQEGSLAVLSGWGKLSEIDYTRRALRKVTMKVHSFKTCSKDENLALIIEDKSQICSIEDEGKGLCDVDEGGPLVLNGVVIGVASLRQGVDCIKGKVIFTSVYQCMDYITNEINTQICRSYSPGTTVMARIEDY